MAVAVEGELWTGDVHEAEAAGGGEDSDPPTNAAQDAKECCGDVRCSLHVLQLSIPAKILFQASESLACIFYCRRYIFFCYQKTCTMYSGCVPYF